MQLISTRSLAGFAVVGAALFLSACINSTDDQAIDPLYANTKVDARVAGQSLAEGFNQGKDWTNTMTAPTGLQSLGDISTKVEVLKKQTALPKRADLDLGGNLQANLDDTANGYATFHSETKLLLETVSDTAVIKWDDQARDSIKDNEHVISWKRVVTHAFGNWESSEFTDGDKDGLITPKPDQDNRVRINLTKTENGTVEKTTLVVGAGPDFNFDHDSDNTVIEAVWTKTKDGVVVGQGAYLDGDNDGLVVNNIETSVVLAKYSEMNPKNRPLIAKVTVDAKVRVFAKSVGGDEPISFSYQEETVSGRVNTATITNRSGGAEIVRGDTMTVRLETTVAQPGDTLKHAVLELVMNPGQDLKSDLDDSCYAIHITSEKQLGFERSAEFNFISAHPIPHGQKPTAGTFDATVKYANGKTAGLEGSFSPTGFSATFKGPDGGTAAVEFTLGGDLVSGGDI